MRFLEESYLDILRSIPGHPVSGLSHRSRSGEQLG